jgi:tannase
MTALDEFYRQFLVPGGAHCGSNSGGWPQTTLQTAIECVEEDVVPETLKGTDGIVTICRWPLRPPWSRKNFSCF